MRLTTRCHEILKLLSAARWLRTRQLHRRFFAAASVDAAQKRLHKLVEGRYLAKVQPNRMQDALFTLGPEGRRTLERAGIAGVLLERQPPKHLEHFLGVNDVRIAAESSLSVSYFFAYWELPSVDWKHPIIPDAVFGTSAGAFAVEFDRGNENVKFFLGKLRSYERGLKGLPLNRVLIVTDRRPRMEILAKATAVRARNVLLTTLDLVQQRGLADAIFFENSTGRGVKLL